jgi:hypothetical protein
MKFDDKIDRLLRVVVRIGLWGHSVLTVGGKEYGKEFIVRCIEIVFPRVVGDSFKSIYNVMRPSSHVVHGNVGYS